MKTEKLVQSENKRRMEKLAKSKIGIVLLILLASAILCSCKTHFTTEYKITSYKRAYYCNHPQFVNDTIRGAELKRNGKIRNVFEIPYDSVVSVEYRNKVYNWK